MNRLGQLLLALLLVALASACGVGGQGGQEAAAASAVEAADAPATPHAPPVGACYRLDVASALKAASTRPVVPCSRSHTTVTVAVGTAQPVLDGHLLALDSTAVQRQIADRCRRAVDSHVGGSSQNRRLSRVQAVWFTPTPDQADRGALWFRCDLAISSGSRTFAALPRKTSGLLDATGAMSRWGTCGTASPSARHFERVLCSAKHSWRARTATTLPAGTTYLSKKAAKAADAHCRDVAARLSPKSKKLRWAYEWPTRSQWHAGQRYGFCWTPD